MNSLSILDPSEKTVSLQNSIGMPIVQEADISDKAALLVELPDQTKVKHRFLPRSAYTESFEIEDWTRRPMLITWSGDE